MIMRAFLNRKRVLITSCLSPRQTSREIEVTLDDFIVIPCVDELARLVAGHALDLADVVDAGHCELARARDALVGEQFHDLGRHALDVGEIVVDLVVDA